jgi:hypothetical protein
MSSVLISRVVSHKYLYLICHSCGGSNPEPKPLEETDKVVGKKKETFKGGI